MLTNSSFQPTQPPAHQTEAVGTPVATGKTSPFTNIGNNQPASSHETLPASAFLLPSFQYIPAIPTDPASIEAFIQAFILPSQLHQSHDSLTREQKNVLRRQPERQKSFVGARKADEILVLICGHGGRDSRCGILGPLLKAEFEDKLKRQNIPFLDEPPVAEAVEVETEVEGYTPTARVGLISHIGGHKWAGNVIVYIPPSFKANPLAGKGIWYSRVGPEHVEGIVEKTVVEGKVIKELFRGGIDQERAMLRL